MASHAAAAVAAAKAAAPAVPNPNCTLIVPAHPLTARGLATPYSLVATDPNQGPCNENNANQSAFVQGVIYNPTTGAFSVYSPLVIDKGTRPAARPHTINLPAGAVVALWFGFNGTNLQLQGSDQNALADGSCVNGSAHQSLFGQFAYCNAPAFFAAANQGIVAHLIQVPPLPVAKDGAPCPTMRDFSVIDQDQSDNVQTQYLATNDGRIAQFSAANQAKLPGATLVANPSDNALLTHFIDPALGCTAWTAPDLANGGNAVAALPLDELQASVDQTAPIALVPLTDPMTTIARGNNNLPSLTKTNLYRMGVDQIPAATNHDASGTTYCQNFLRVGMSRVVLDKQFTIHAPSPAPTQANNLFTFLAMRFQASYTNLNCANLLNTPNPVKTVLNKAGIVVSASFGLVAPPPPARGSGPVTPIKKGTATPVGCTTKSALTLTA
ncbi:hypothetical protein ccbrp13_19810 [Ktedonobacteria bacterium brp13]|nr:hypothetical protein ccbrp13_19810 [Ktedonobacteria bacterium brp13]